MPKAYYESLENTRLEVTINAFDRQKINNGSIKKMKGLPEEAVKEVMDFIEFLRSKKENAKRGSPEAILRHIGAWKFEKGELDNILADIQIFRELEG